MHLCSISYMHFYRSMQKLFLPMPHLLFDLKCVIILNTYIHIIVCLIVFETVDMLRPSKVFPCKGDKNDKKYERSLISKLARLWRTPLWTQDQCSRKMNKIYNLQQKEYITHTKQKTKHRANKWESLSTVRGHTIKKMESDYLWKEEEMTLSRCHINDSPFCLSITNNRYHWLNFCYREGLFECITSGKQFDRFIYISFDNNKK